jgi:hypothetical protein
MPLIRAQRRAQEGHIVFFEERPDHLRVWRPHARDRPKLFVKFMAATRGVDDDHFTRLIGQVEEGMRHVGGHISKATFFEVINLVPDADLVTALQDVNGLFLLVMNVQRRSASGRHLDDEIIKGATGILAGNFENQIPAWAGLQPQPMSPLISMSVTRMPAQSQQNAP